MGDARLQTLEVRASLANDTPWASAGWTIAEEQVSLKEVQTSRVVESVGHAPSIKDNETTIVVSCGRTVWEWNRETGRLVRWALDGQPVLSSEMFASFWKPTNRNQAGNDYAKRRSAWREASEPRPVASLSALAEQDRAVVTVRHKLPFSGASTTVRYTAHASGQLEVLAEYTPTASPTAPSLPRFGLEFRVLGPVDRIAWLGRGPHENYPDRCRSALLGAYEVSLERFCTDYIYPQDNGARTGVRRMQLRPSSGRELRIDAVTPLIARVWPYTTADVEDATHQSNLPRRDDVTVHLDAAIHGVGGDNSWGKRTMAKYTVPADRSQCVAVLLSPGSPSARVASAETR